MLSAFQVFRNEALITQKNVSKKDACSSVLKKYFNSMKPCPNTGSVAIAEARQAIHHQSYIAEEGIAAIMERTYSLNDSPQKICICSFRLLLISLAGSFAKVAWPRRSSFAKREDGQVSKQTLEEEEEGQSFLCLRGKRREERKALFTVSQVGLTDSGTATCPSLTGDASVWQTHLE